VAPMGYGPLADWAAEHTAALHSPPAREQLSTTITGGANQSLEVRRRPPSRSALDVGPHETMIDAHCPAVQAA